MLTVSILWGCTTYTIRTKDGREFQSKSEPVKTSDDFYKFTTKDGRKVLLKTDEISVISED